MAESFRDLVAWQRAMELVTEIYKATESFPSREMYGLTNQIRRAAVSIPSNIAEGKGRYSKKEFVQFLINARGSLCETHWRSERTSDMLMLAASVSSTKSRVRSAASSMV